MFIIAACSIYLIYTTANVTINQYNETLTWQNTAYVLFASAKSDATRDTRSIYVCPVAVLSSSSRLYNDTDNSLSLDRSMVSYASGMVSSSSK